MADSKKIYTFLKKALNKCEPENVHDLLDEIGQQALSWTQYLFDVSEAQDIWFDSTEAVEDVIGKAQLLPSDHKVWRVAFDEEDVPEHGGQICLWFSGESEAKIITKLKDVVEVWKKQTY